MTTRQSPAILMISLFLLTLLMSGCALNMPQPGAIAKPDARSPLVDGTVNKGVLQTKDLVLAHSISVSGSQYTLEGNLYLEGWITNSFPLVRSFVLKMSFLDSQGSVLTTVNITPIMSRHNIVPDDITLRKSGILPPGTKAVAFSYVGEFMDGVNGRDSASWDIWYSPFEKKPR